MLNVRLVPTLLFTLLTLSTLAADKLDVDLTPSALRVRSEAPIPTQVRFKWTGTYILEGRFEVELREGNRVLGRYRSGDLALTTGEQSFHLLLPPCIDPYADSQVEAHMKFVAAKQEIDLGYSILFMATMRERAFVVGWCNAHFGADQPASMQQEFLFERFAPTNADTARRLLVTSVVRLAPEDLPAQPLAYTSFDVMVLTSDAFKEAREGQLKALARWVKGGGSVCVFVNGGLHAHHAAFLNELAEASAIEPAFVAADDGNLMSGPQKISCFYSGLGRSVVVLGSAPTQLGGDPAPWRKAIAFLWKFRAAHAQAIAATGHWQPEPNRLSEDLDAQLQVFQQGARRPARPPQPYRNFTDLPSYSVSHSGLGAELTARLMPHTVRLIPFPALMGTLGLFLLMIGPVDYFVLGALRRRKYTWLLFPATSIAFSIATVAMANYYLGLRDQRRSLTVVDIGSDGSALRWNRYELVFAARDKQVVTELKDALWAPLDSGPINGMPYNMPYGYNPGVNYRPPPPGINPRYNYNYAVRYRGGEMQTEAGPAWYEGAVPVHFRTSQAIHQWQPVLNRTFSFEPPLLPLLANWTGVEKAWPDLKAIRSSLSEKKPFTGDLCIISSDGSVTYDPGADNRPGAQTAAPLQFNYDTADAPSYQVTINRSITNWVFGYSALRQLSVGGSDNLESLVSQISPNGGGNFEDEQAMDTTAGDSALLIITQSGDDIIVYRRFFHAK